MIVGGQIARIEVVRLFVKDLAANVRPALYDFDNTVKIERELVLQSVDEQRQVGMLQGRVLLNLLVFGNFDLDESSHTSLCLFPIIVE